MTNKLAFKKDIRMMSKLVRFNTVNRLHEQSLADHSYYVVLYTQRICDFLKISEGIKLDALEYALIHDIPEIHLGDITYDVKHGYEQFEKYYEELELELVKEKYPSYYNLFERQGAFKEIVKLADWLDKGQWAEYELSLGNKDPEIKFIYDHYKEVLKSRIKKATNNRFGESYRVKELLDFVLCKESNYEN